MLVDPSRFKVKCLGRRCGKTVSCIDACLLGHGPRMPNGRRLRKGALFGANIWWVVPKIDDADIAVRHALRALKHVPHKYSKSKRRFEFRGGGILWIRSADNPQGLRGDSLDGVVLDEARNIHEDAWYESIRPSLSDKEGWGIIISTPNGYDWFHNLYQFARKTKDWTAWQMPTSTNQRIRPSEIESAKNELGPVRFQQEYEAKFVVAEGLFWNPTLFDHVFDWKHDVNVTRHGWPTSLLLSLQTVDTSFGKKNSDYQSIVNLGTRQDGHLYCEAGMGLDGLDGFAKKIVRMAYKMPVWPSWTRIEEFEFKDKRALVKDATRQAAVDRGRALFLDTINPQEHNFETKPIGGQGLKEVRIAALDPYFRKHIFRMVDTRETRMLIDEATSFRMDGKAAHDDGLDALARGVDSYERLTARQEGEQLDDEGSDEVYNNWFGSVAENNYQYG